ncbi:hypothetical protein Rcae01_05907 [Novipirellula caenicola]|uniref:Uncharacterized protein n=1 Tax=Novipirellula caenicola TaxID=1536901 RepID=A0ABP9VZ37_9BACT
MGSIVDAKNKLPETFTMMYTILAQKLRKKIAIAYIGERFLPLVGDFKRDAK